MIFSTSYKGRGFRELISGLVKIYEPKTIVELGTQQGSSAILMAKAMEKGHLYAYDLFQERYSKPPYNLTKSNLIKTKKNIAANKLTNKITIRRKDALLAYRDFKKIDMLHMDIGNYYETVYSVLSKWHNKVNKLIILEGGVFNRWQRKCGFRPFNKVLETPFIKNNYDKVVIQKDDHYAITILIRKWL